MEAYQEILLRKLRYLKKGRALATDAAEHLRLDVQIEEAEKQLRASGIEPEKRTVSPAAAPKPTAIEVDRDPAPPKKSAAFPWWAISLAVGLATFALLWWVIGLPKIAAVLAVVVAVFLLLRDPDRFFMTITYSCLGLLTAINVIDPSGFLAGEGENLRFRLELSEPSVWVSLFLIALMGWAMWLEGRR